MSREEALDTALGQIERQFGKGAVMRMNDRAHVSVGADVDRVARARPRARDRRPSSREDRRDLRPESSGKTTLVYHVIAEAQRRGGICAFIDAEHAMDPQYARRIGVNIDDLLVSQPDNGEQALEIAELLIRSGALSVVAVDSVAALTPRAEIEGEMGDSHVGLQARLMSQALRKLAGTLNRTETICIFTNQLREKIGVMFGNPGDDSGRPRAQVLLVGPPRHPPHRDAEGRRRGDRQPRPRQGREEQGRAAVQAGRVRHHLRAGISWEGTVLDTGPRAEGGPEVGLVLQLPGGAARPGSPERNRVPARAPRRRRRRSSPRSRPRSGRPGRLCSAAPNGGGQRHRRRARSRAEVEAAAK